MPGALANKAVVWTDSGFEMRCNGCLEYWPLTTEYWPVRGGRRLDTGRRLSAGLNKCLACRREVQHRYYGENRDQVRAARRRHYDPAVERIKNAERRRQRKERAAVDPAFAQHVRALAAEAQRRYRARQAQRAA